MRINAWLFLVPFFLLVTSSGSAQQRKDWLIGPNPPEGAYDEVHRFIFYAVLEGCFEEGVTNEDLEHIIPTAENGMRKMRTNFVIACPLCGPAYDAFNFYAGRPRLTQPAKITNYTTYGSGLDAEVRKQLATPGLPCRDAIQGLIGKWVDNRIEKLRLSEEETKALREELAAKRKKGEEFLAGFQKGFNGDELEEAYRDWERCPVCSGSSPMGGTAP